MMCRKLAVNLIHLFSIFVCHLVCRYLLVLYVFFFFFSSRRRHTRFKCDWSSDVCSSDLFLDSFRLVHYTRVTWLGSVLARAALIPLSRMHFPLASRTHSREFMRLPSAKIGRASCRERV